MWIYIFALCIGLSTALPQGSGARSQRQSAPQAPAQAQSSTPIPIINQTDILNPDGSFNFSYETGNGIKVQEAGYIKQDPNVQARSGAEGEEGPAAIQVIQGSYSYTAPDGQVISLKYIADENGFQPEGDHIPPIPEEIKRALEYEKQVST